MPFSHSFATSVYHTARLLFSFQEQTNATSFLMWAHNTTIGLIRRLLLLLRSRDLGECYDRMAFVGVSFVIVLEVEIVQGLL